MALDNIPTALDLADFARTAARSPDAPEPTPTGEVSALAKARIEADEAAAQAAGFAVAPPLFAAGTRVRPDGDGRFHTIRQEVAKLPTFEAGAQQVIDVVKAEKRRDAEVPMSILRMVSDGRLHREGREHLDGLLIEPRAFGALCARAGFGRGTAYLRDHCDPELRAFNVNAQLMALDRSKGPQAKLRTRLDANGQHSVYGVVSPRYAAYDVDRFLADVTPALADTHAEIVYNPETSSLRADAFWMPDDVVDLAAGDVFKVGVRLRTADDGSGSVKVEAVLFRNLCLNLIIIGEAKVETVRERHIGDVARIAGNVVAGVESAREKVGHFLQQWGHARTLQVDVEAEIAKATEGAVKAGAPKGMSDRLKAAFALAYAKEPGGTVADVSNAVTRAAHEGAFPQDVRDTLEAYGAEYVRQAVAVAA
jgi:hypothetical protein